MKTLFYTLAAFVLLTSSTCKKQAGGPDIEKNIIGKWQYTGKSGGFAGKTEQADPAKVTILEFKKGHQFVRTLNDQVTAQGPYEIIKTRSIYTGKDDNAILFNAQTDTLKKGGSIITIRNDSLTIADNVYDGFTSGYIRIRK